MKDYLIVTNNEFVFSKYRHILDIHYLEKADLVDILEHSRDLIHRGAKLLSHPIAGSMKPNQTPTRSILFDKNELAKSSQEGPRVDFSSLRLIENSLHSAQVFLSFRQTTDWPQAIKEDFQKIDLSIIESAIQRI